VSQLGLVGSVGLGLSLVTSLGLGLNVWNSLPNEVVEVDTINIIKNRLVKYWTN